MPSCNGADIDCDSLTMLPGSQHHRLRKQAEFPLVTLRETRTEDLLVNQPEKQTTTEARQRGTGAAGGLAQQWRSIDRKKFLRQVRRLQRRIAKAVTEGRWNKVKVLQRILTRSHSAKVLAVLKATSNRGARTPGVDGKRWITPAQKMRGVLSLDRRGYRALPLRRIHIPKKAGSTKTRPIGIPVIRDRAMQALHQMALEPVAETQADPNSYGFRPYRGVWDAIAQCFCVLGKKISRCRWIYEADIQACFDGISHPWMLENITMDRDLLQQWLQCGYISDRKLFPITAGTPQGGIISPTLCNCVLDGMEETIRQAVPKSEKVYFVRYADDFIVAAENRETLQQRVQPAVQKFLAKRDLQLSAEKTRITHVKEGFDFLGKHVRQFGDKLIITPAKKNVKAICQKIRDIVRRGRGRSAAELIRQLNPVIRGWAQAHRTVQATEAFSYVEKQTFDAIWQWCLRSHPSKSKTWIFRKYYRRQDGKGWGRFHATERDRSGKLCRRELVRPQDVPLVRYIKIRGNSNPHDAQDGPYFSMRRKADHMTELSTRGRNSQRKRNRPNTAKSCRGRSPAVF
jgi:RNA-directed DNA polymerase